MILRAISDVREAHLSKLIIDSLKYDSKLNNRKINLLEAYLQVNRCFDDDSTTTQLTIGI